MILLKLRLKSKAVRIKQESDNPTVGLILCTEKCDEMAKYLLGEKEKQIFASTYKLHLPTEKELEKELKRELKFLETNLNDNLDS